METRYQEDFILLGREVVFFSRLKIFAAYSLNFLFLIQMNKSNPSEPCFPGLQRVKLFSLVIIRCLRIVFTEHNYSINVYMIIGSDGQSDQKP